MHWAVSDYLGTDMITCVTNDRHRRELVSLVNNLLIQRLFFFTHTLICAIEVKLYALAKLPYSMCNCMKISPRAMEGCMVQGSPIAGVEDEYRKREGRLRVLAVPTATAIGQAVLQV